MYTQEQMDNMFESFVVNKYYFVTYKAICEYFQKHPTDEKCFNYHHIYPSFLYKETHQLKNRYWTIEKLDEEYKPNDNVVKLPVKWHVIAHYCLAMALLTQDAKNSFFTLVEDYTKPIESYSFNEVQTLSQLVYENSLPNTSDHYMTVSERKEKGRKIFYEIKEKYESDNKEDIEEYKEEYKRKQKEYTARWKEEHKEEIEEKKRKQKEYFKMIKEEWKNKEKESD